MYPYIQHLLRSYELGCFEGLSTFSVGVRMTRVYTWTPKTNHQCLLEVRKPRRWWCCRRRAQPWNRRETRFGWGVFLEREEAVCVFWVKTCLGTYFGGWKDPTLRFFVVGFLNIVTRTRAFDPQPFLILGLLTQRVSEHPRTMWACFGGICCLLFSLWHLKDKSKLMDFVCPTVSLFFTPYRVVIPGCSFKDLLVYSVDLLRLARQRRYSGALAKIFVG